MKKFIIAILAGLMAVFAAIGLAGCGDKQTDEVTVTYVYSETRSVPVSIEKGGLAVERSADSPQGQKFLYWYETDENTPFDFSTPIEEDITLHAKYGDDRVTLSFYAEPDDAVPYRTVTKGRGELLDYADVLTVSVSKPNYNFTGWTNADGTAFRPGFLMTDDVNVYASYELKKFTVVYYGRTGEELKREEVTAFEDSQAPDAPVLPDCEFKGFDAHEDIVESMADEKGEVAVYAHYLPLSGTIETEGATFSYSIKNDRTGYILRVSEITGGEIELPETAAEYPTDEVLPFTEIPANLFEGNRTITSVTIPAGYESIGNSAFAGCSKLVSVQFEGESSLLTLGNSAFENCTALESFTLPATLTRIGAMCFKECNALVSVGGRATALTTIASEAFSGCDVLQTVSFAYMSALETIGMRAFYNCQALTAARLDGSKELTSIGDQAFYYDYGCASISFYTGADAKLATIGDRAFYGAGSAELNFPDSLKRIGAAAFAITDKQENGAIRISLPGTVEYIGDAAFTNDCYGRLAEIEVRGATESSAYYSHEGKALIRRGTNGDTFMLYACAAEGTAYTTPANIKTIHPYAFSNLVNLQTLTISEGPEAIPVVMAYNERIVTVDSEGFIITGYASCPLTRVNFPASLRKIGLTDAEADGYITRWGDLQTTVISPFGGCDKLEEVTFPANSNLEIIGNKAFYTSGLEKIVIPASCNSVSPLAFYQTGLKEYKIADGSANFSVVKGMLASADGTTIYSFPYGGAVSTEGVITIPSTVRTVATNAFRFSEDITKIVFETDEEGNGVTRLEDGSFNGFRNLEELVLPASLEYIGDDVFTGTYVVDLVIPAKVRHIGIGSFCNLPDLKTLTFEGELPEIVYDSTPTATNAFMLCNSIDFCYVPADQYETYLAALPLKNIKKFIDCKSGYKYILQANDPDAEFHEEIRNEYGALTKTNIIKGSYEINSALLLNYPRMVKEGAYFIGWYTKSGADGDWGTRVYDFNHATEHETTLYARWSETAVEDGRSRETAYTLTLDELFTVPDYIFGTDLVFKFTAPLEQYADQVFGLSGFGYDSSRLYSYNIRLYRDAPLTGSNLLSADARQNAWMIDGGITHYIVITNVVSKVYASSGLPVYKDGDTVLEGQSFVIRIGTLRISGGNT